MTKGKKMKGEKIITDKDIAKEARRLIKGFKKIGNTVIDEDIELLKELAKY